MNLRVKIRHRGYTPGVPPQPAAGVDAAAVDAAICEELMCGRCGQEGMTYFPFVGPASYRAVAVCPRCGCEEEI